MPMDTNWFLEGSHVAPALNQHYTISQEATVELALYEKGKFKQINWGTHFPCYIIIKLPKREQTEEV